MKKWIALMTCAACTFSSAVYSDAAAEQDIQKLTTAVEMQEALAADDDSAETDDQSRKQVGKAAADGSRTAGSNAGKYVLAAGAIAVAVTALIVVSRHTGHHHHKHSHSHSH
jgi:hypothetical protein